MAEGAVRWGLVGRERQESRSSSRDEVGIPGPNSTVARASPTAPHRSQLSLRYHLGA